MLYVCYDDKVGVQHRIEARVVWDRRPLQRGLLAPVLPLTLILIVLRGELREGIQYLDGLARSRGGPPSFPFLPRLP
eukprot:gene16144-biopygen8849